MRHGLYVTIVCYVLLAIVVDRGTRSVPLFVVLERDRLRVLMDMDRLSKRKFVIVCHEKMVMIPLEGDEILRVQCEHTQGVVKTLMNTKVDLVHGATLVAKSPYRLAPSKMQELSEQLQELQDEVGDALSRKESVKSRRVRGMILAAQSEVFKQEDVLVERLHGLDQQMERKGDESLYFMDRIWVLLLGSVMDEAHTSRYLVKAAMSKTFGLLQQPEILE
ncbi:hypothetical protein Tco_0881802 [Tanacetum coccineum]